MSSALLRTVLLSVIVLGASPAILRAEGSDAREWLVRMEQAVESLSYEGTFVHMVGNSIETMHVIHRAVDGDVAERLFSRDQPGREILRHNDKVTCIFADQRTVLVDRRKDRRTTPLLGAVPQDADETQLWYQFIDVGEGHKLGRAVRVIEIRPQDSYRYGHRLWLDQLTAMPLKIQLLAPEGVVLEQIQFVSMVVPAEISDARLQADVEVEGFSWYEQDQNSALPPPDRQGAGWTVDEPPPGFMLTEARMSILPGAEYPVEHLVYSDGMASVSVFIEPAEANDQELAGLSRMGAAHAYTLMIGDRQITAVGEVPPVTVERLARSLRQVEAPAN